MAELDDFILETTNAPGTSATVNLAGAVTGARAFASAFSTGTDVFYYLKDDTQAEWGIGHFVAGSPNTLTRTTVILNTANNTSRLNFLGLTEAYNEIPSTHNLYLDATNSLQRSFAALLLVMSGTTQIVSTGDVHINRGTDGYLDISAARGELHHAAEVRLNAQSTGIMTFIANSVERMRLNASGNLLFNSTADDPVTSNTNGVAFRAPSFSGGGPIMVVNAQTTSGIKIGTGGSGQAVLTFVFQGSGTVGSVTATSTGVAYNVTSDYRKKTNLEPLSGALDRIIRLPTYRFNWIGHEDAPKVDGMLAHEIAEIVPEAVHGEKDAVGADGEMIVQGVDYSKLVPLLIAGLQEATARIAALEAAR